MFGNAKISYYDIHTQNIIEDIFYEVNHTALGDVCQSLYMGEHHIFAVINNSSKVWVLNKNNFQIIGQINGLNSPRYFLQTGNSKAYVTDLYADKIAVIDLNNYNIQSYINLPGWTEELLYAFGNVYVTNKESHYLYIINSATDILTDSINIGYGANSIVKDKYDKIWVLCNGNQNETASLICINPVNKQIEKNFSFQNGQSPWRLDINSGKDTLYYLNNGVYQMPVNSSQLPVSPLIAQGNRNFYGIGIEPHSGIIYVADAIDYVQRGKIYRYTPNGTLINTFFAGIIPGDFYFE
jgi:DNA-binding beta-propeller fold protein YncE